MQASVNTNAKNNAKSMQNQRKPLQSQFGTNENQCEAYAKAAQHQRKSMQSQSPFCSHLVG